MPHIANIKTAAAKRIHQRTCMFSPIASTYRNSISPAQHSAACALASCFSALRRLFSFCFLHNNCTHRTANPAAESGCRTAYTEKAQ